MNLFAFYCKLYYSENININIIIVSYDNKLLMNYKNDLTVKNVKKI